MNDLILSVAIFSLIVAIMIILRLRFGEKFEIKNSDILIAIIPVALWLVLSGKIHKLEFGEFKIEAAFVEASKTTIANQVTPIKLPVEPVRMGSKEGIGEIPRLIESKTEAIVFQLGYGGYVGPVIEEYLRSLSSFLKFIVINDSNGKFFGLADARGGFRSYDLAHWINNSDIASLSRLPGFISNQNAIGNTADKQTALEKMESLNVETLPVVDEQEKFIGVVTRSRLTASLIIDVANKVK